MFWLVAFFVIGATFYTTDKVAGKVFPAGDNLAGFLVAFTVIALPLIGVMLLLEWSYDKLGILNFFDSVLMDKNNPSGYSTGFKHECPTGSGPHWLTIIGAFLKYFPGGIIMILTGFATPVVLLTTFLLSLYSVLKGRIEERLYPAFIALVALVVGWFYVLVIGGWYAGTLLTRCT